MACAPGEITLIASSTSTGVLDITLTTGTSPASLRPMNSVVMPAATEMTSLSGETTGLISSSSAPMSCGLTAITSVCALSAAFAAVQDLDAVRLAQLLGPVTGAARPQGSRRA